MNGNIPTDNTTLRPWDTVTERDAYIGDQRQEIKRLHGLLDAAITERNEARGLARNLYSAAHELRRFAEAYADDYDEVDGKQGALEAISDFYDAIKDIAKILGEEDAK